MKKIFVIGAGTMGAGIVQAFAQKGYEVIVRDIKDEFVERGINGINKGLSRLVAKGKMTEEELKAKTNYFKEEYINGFCKSFSESITEKTKIASLDYDDAYIVTKYGTYPSVLVEAAYASCTVGADKINSAEWRDNFCQKLAEAIINHVG